MNRMWLIDVSPTMGNKVSWVPYNRSISCNQKLRTKEGGRMFTLNVNTEKTIRLRGLYI